MITQRLWATELGPSMAEAGGVENLRKPDTSQKKLNSEAFRLKNL